MLCLFNRKRKFSNSPQTKLTDSSGVSGDFFGWWVALSADGNTAIVGSPEDTVGSNSRQGSCTVFTRTGTSWNQQAKLTDSTGNADNYFGISVALSDDGNTAIVGSYRKKVGSNNEAGAAIVFTRSGSTWTEQAELTDSAPVFAGAQLGISVSLSSDGNTALVGAQFDTIGSNYYQGSAIVFTRSGVTWTQQTKLVDSAGAASDNFGTRVKLSGDGNTALVGSLNDDPNGTNNQGSAIVFTNSGGTWTQQATLIHSLGSTSARFSRSLALSDDGNTALIGSDIDYAVVFTRSGATWTEETTLTNLPITAFGYSVDLSGNGNVALIGARLDDSISNNQGNAVVFIRNSGVWAQQVQLDDSDGVANDQFGRAVALSKDGNVALISSILDNANQGSAVVFYRR